MRLINADRLLEDKRIEKYYHLKNGDIAIPLIDIKHAPTVEERKTGKWIEYDSDEDKYDIIKCPCCKHTFTVDSFHWTDIGFVKDDFKFCPNCGADMRERREE